MKSGDKTKYVYQHYWIPESKLKDSNELKSLYERCILDIEEGLGVINQDLSKTLGIIDKFKKYINMSFYLKKVLSLLIVKLPG